MEREPAPVIPRDAFEQALIRTFIERDLGKWPAAQMHMGDGPDDAGRWPIIFTRDTPFDVFTLISQPHGYGWAWVERREDDERQTPVVWWAVTEGDLVPYAQTNSGGSPVLVEQSPPSPTDITPAEMRRRRRALDMTQDEFAERLGVSQATVARWERGANPIADPAVQ